MTARPHNPMRFDFSAGHDLVPFTPLPLSTLRSLTASPESGTAGRGGTAVPYDSPTISMANPFALQEGERIELWLPLPGAPEFPPSAQLALLDDESAIDETNQAVATDEIDGGDAQGDSDTGGWDVRPAQVVGITGGFVAVAAGGWGLSGEPETPSAPGQRAAIRRVRPDGIVEWDATIATRSELVDVAAAEDTLGTPAGPAGVGSAEAILVLRLDPAAGQLYQRRRSKRLLLRLVPIRLVPESEGPDGAEHAAPFEDDDMAPLARLSDVSESGAGIVVDVPLKTGTTVAIEFELPGEQDPFAVQGRVVEPAVGLHGEAQPQPDGLPGFRRGVEFLGGATTDDGPRLASVLTRLLQSERTRN
ncbi:MAG: hypothetical protein AVDCRST_MAG77-431 [uncultured Chloroflexi bacterium]|uniref:PilZ domain-containing protein n=1 Tax=uncultured Chloroflexota bacterium TaxID=166587 RepID=A0A6J4HBT2_9CHLR|nr:MAG: hypothetical protein AVDCRST_MAG77-431 [uncultured Chloroflexota bacterium]